MCFPTRSQSSPASFYDLSAEHFPEMTVSAPLHAANAGKTGKNAKAKSKKQKAKKKQTAALKINR